MISLDEQTKKDFVYEVCSSLYYLRNFNVKYDSLIDFRIEMAPKMAAKFPCLSAPKAQFSLVLAPLFKYIAAYESEVDEILDIPSILGDFYWMLHS